VHVHIAGYLPSEGRGNGEGRISFFKAESEKGRRRKGWFKKSFSQGKMKEGVGFEILRRKG